MKNFDLKSENGKPRVSFENLIVLTYQHGDIVGAIHQIKKGKAEFKKGGFGTYPYNCKHSTLFFFLDGFAHECLGFTIGNTSPGTCLIKPALQKIPFVGLMVEEDYLTSEKFIQLVPAKEENKSLAVIFRPPSKLMNNFSIIRDCNGLKIMRNYIIELGKSGNYVLEENW